MKKYLNWAFLSYIELLMFSLDLEETIKLNILTVKILKFKLYYQLQKIINPMNFTCTFIKARIVIGIICAKTTMEALNELDQLRAY